MWTYRMWRGGGFFLMACGPWNGLKDLRLLHRPMAEHGISYERAAMRIQSG